MHYTIEMMRKLLPILMVFGVFLGSAGESFALPECPGSPTSNKFKVEGDMFSSGWSNCVGTRIFPNGSRKRGVWEKGKFKGPEKITPSVYRGNLPKCQGSPIYNWDGVKVNRSWRYCFGVAVSRSGDKYVGEFKNSKPHGHGAYTYADGSINEGMWANGYFKYAQKASPTVTAKNSPKPTPNANQRSLPECPGSPTSDWNKIKHWTDCFGTEIFSGGHYDGSTYVGEWKNGRSHGQGILTFTGYGSKQEGIWENGELVEPN